MPFKSEAQRKKFGELVSQGKIKQSTFDEFNRATKGPLPERVTSKQGRSQSFLAPQVPNVKPIKPL